MFEDAAEVPRHPRDLFLGQSEIGQLRYAANFLFR